MDWNTRPIERWPKEQTKNRRHSQFNSTYGQTLRLLDQELRHLRAKNIVLEVALTEKDFRVTDGKPRAKAKYQHPGVILSFDGKNGPMKIPCDTYIDAEDNLRAIALSLEALRKVDRYGVSTHGEQYRGWKALPGAVEMPASMTVEEAARFLYDAAGGDDRLDIEVAYRVAAKCLHPDHGGDRAQWDKLQDAIGIMRKHHGVEHG